LILALIPAHNEARHIAMVVTGVRAHLPVLVVDDGSTDATAAVPKRPARPCGVSRPTRERGQHDPAEIPTFLKAYSATHANLIIGARNFRYMPLLRRTSNSLGRLTFSWALGRHVPDNQSGYRLVRRWLTDATRVSPERGFEFEMDMIVVAKRSGFRLQWVPVRTIYAGESSHIRKWHHLVNFLRLACQTPRG
jgi:hypothetical protein